MLICVVKHHSVVHHCSTKMGVGNVVGMLAGFGMGSQTPDSGGSRESLPVGAHWEAEGGRVVEGLGWGMGWCCPPADGAWEDGLVHVAHVAAHCVGACCCALVVFTWASTCCIGVVVVHVANIA
jgi:hypothetical protein